ncbi:hypothetical protein Ferp_1117 [Ferroglobus placidus DSM 10642]|uniref:SprT-like domain-containing protein n=1 Tax=Ferroglobus placidus (strain DSM 10642 / AEDII12DO) TaxID=589924 RepID=D3RXR3_FERPA|nr:DUF45 domain-containing protein [Ferroglobus placidus]ADC65276.1 hypothetical protein Ferp_1117 [Ferroglobus placidus DSM 10642]
MRVVVKSKRIPKKLEEEVKKVIKRYFPEIDGVLLYYTGSAYGKYLRDWKIALNPIILKKPKRILYHTVAHEVTHLIQWQQEKVRSKALKTEYSFLYTQRIPKGEKACEIWTYARHPDLVAPSYYLSVELKKLPNSKKFLSAGIEFYEERSFEIHRLAKKAIKLRERGVRNYIKWFLNELNSIFG